MKFTHYAEKLIHVKQQQERETLSEIQRLDRLKHEIVQKINTADSDLAANSQAKITHTMLFYQELKQKTFQGRDIAQLELYIQKNAARQDELRLHKEKLMIELGKIESACKEQRIKLKMLIVKQEKLTFIVANPHLQAK